MKSFLLFIVFSLPHFGRSLFAQITLEHSYENGGGGNWSGINQLMMVDFEDYGLRYVKIDRINNEILFYDLNHNLTKTISVPNNLLSSDGVPNWVLYLSQKLFDLDDGIEYMIATQPIPNDLTYKTYFYDEDGTQLFFKQDQSPLVFLSIPEQQFPIYNTPNGTKLILSSTANDSAFVYSLPGNLATFIQEQNNSLLQQMNSSGVYPNPSNQVSTIEYKIAPSDLPATLKIYDATGKQIASANISSVKGKIEIPLSGFSSGTYEYQIQSGVKTLSSGKFIVSQ